MTTPSEGKMSLSTMDPTTILAANPLPESNLITVAQMSSIGNQVLSLQQQQPHKHGSDDCVSAFHDDDGGSEHGGSGDDGAAARSGRASCHYTQHQPIAEFLYQLTKMLTDDNDEVIEWDQGRIKVHHPERLEGEILHKYFRHSKFSSFQRQLNYFGFRKIAGKGKMSPCSYVNDAATSDIRSLLLIKRKTNGSAARKAALAQRVSMAAPGAEGELLTSASQSGDFMSSHVMNNNPFMNTSQISNHFPFAAAGPVAAPATSAAAVAASLFPQHSLNVSNIPNIGQLAQIQQLKSPEALAAANFLNTEKALALLLAGAAQQPQQQILQQQQQQSTLPAMTAGPLGDLSLNGFKANTPSLEQLNAQLLSLVAQQQQFNNPNGLTPSAAAPLSLHDMAAAAAAANPALAASAALASMAAQQQQQQQQAQQLQLHHFHHQHQQLQLQQRQQDAQSQQLQLQQHIGSTEQNHATAALAAAAASASMPATAAMNAAAAAGQVNNLFETPYLKSLVNESPAATVSGPVGGGGNAASAAANRSFLATRLPSSNTIFPDQSTASLGNLLTSSNRLSSLLSLSSYLSRDPSLADLLVLPNNNNSNNIIANQGPASAGVAGLEFSRATGGQEGKAPF